MSTKPAATKPTPKAKPRPARKPAAKAPAKPAAKAKPATAKAPTLQERYASWPEKGDDRAQPWDLDAVGVDPADRELEDGAENTVSPVVPQHAYPILTPGCSSAAVQELGRRLLALGYDTSVSEGTNPFGIYDDSVQRAIERFREDYNVHEDPTAYGLGSVTDAAKARADRNVGVFTWEAVIRVSDRTDLDAA